LLGILHFIDQLQIETIDCEGWSHRAHKPKRSEHFVAYAAGEVGLRGSQDIARAFTQGKGTVVGVLQFDMTNYMGSPNDIVLFTDHTDSKAKRFPGAAGVGLSSRP
jgi:Zn-dependent M28 family amino/carboxypeptidase